MLKSTGSQFHGFVRDAYTTLPEVWDRILSTDVDCGWAWKTFSGLNAVKASIPKFDQAWNDARSITMKTFAEEDSPSVQNTMYKMCTSILAAAPSVEAVDYALPNKHYFEIGKDFFTPISKACTNSVQIWVGTKASKTPAKTQKSMLPNQDPTD